MATLIEITDATDPRLGDYRDLRDVQLRKSLESEHGLFLAEGEKVVRRAVESGHEPRSFLMAPRWLDGLQDVLATTEAPCFVLSEELAEEVTGFHVHRGALASLQRQAPPAVEDVLSRASAGQDTGRVRVAILEDLVDHTNVGAAFRNAAALGVDAVLISPSCADPLYRRSIKVSMGTVFSVPWTRVDSLRGATELLREQGYRVAGMSLAEDSITLDDLVDAQHDRLALVFGTEGHGITPATERMLDDKVVIPMMAGVDSLNVAASSAVAFYATR